MKDIQPLVLKHGRPRRSPKERWVAALVVVSILAAYVWVMYLLFGHLIGGPDWETFGKMSRKLMDDFGKAADHQIEFLVLIVVSVVHLWYSRRASKYERLHLDRTGIRYKSPLPGALRALRPDWSLQWSHLREIRIVAPKAMFHPNLVMLEIDAGPIKRKLQALQWSVDTPGKTAEAERVPWRERFLSGLRPARDMERTLREAEQSPIVRYAREAGVRVTTGAGQGIGSGFALEKHRHALVAMVLVLFLLCYAVVDLALNEEIHAVESPLVLFILAGAVAALASMVWLVLARLPRTETLGLSLLLGGAVGFALYPGVLRLNEATDTEGLRVREYRLTEYVVFSPVDAGLPVLKFPKDADYWGQFKLGTTHRFELRRGGLGFYQVNMQPVHERMREYFIGKQ